MEIKAGFVLALIWVQTVCKVYQQLTEVTASKERVNCPLLNIRSTFLKLFNKTCIFIVHALERLRSSLKSQAVFNVYLHCMFCILEKGNYFFTILF